MKYASKFDHFYHDLVGFAKEYWFEVGAFCIGIIVMFWLLISIFNF
ncbi:MAG: hypothetical protein AB8B92_03175 [Gammaproteobacteria bacterium]